MGNNVLARLNFTNRLKIDRGSVRISAKHSNDGAPIVRLEKLELPEDGEKIHGGAIWLTANVYLEAWRIRTNSYFRVLLGTVASIQKAHRPIFAAPLDSFNDIWGVSYRVKVVSDEKKILAQADNLKSDEDTPANHAELIQVYPEELGEQVWMVDWSDVEAGPRVLVNKRLPNPGDFFSANPLVTALVLPNIIREVLKSIVSLNRNGTLENYDWPEHWFEFVRSFYSMPIEFGAQDDGPALAWVDNAIAAFCVAHKFHSTMEGHLTHFAAEDL